MTQRDALLAMLREARPSGRGVCGVDLLNARMPRYAARIWDLRQAGFTISESTCSEHDHSSNIANYTLVADPERDVPVQLRFIA